MLNDGNEAYAYCVSELKGRIPELIQDFFLTIGCSPILLSEDFLLSNRTQGGA
jgi:hypothetical protein